jgi:hypothetical protein
MIFVFIFINTVLIISNLRGCIPTSPGALLTSCAVGAEALSPEAKQQGREFDHPPLSRAEVRNAWSYTFTSSYVFVA